jgi:serine/threonine-protein kinase
MPLELVMSIMRMVGSAIAAAHELGYVHRDLKPQNIFLIPTPLDGHLVDVAKVLDFGISKMRNSTTVKTQENTLLGTPQYMAPEQATGQHAAVDERTDVFALGAIVYEMLTGTPAFSGESIPEVVFKVVYEQPPRLAERAPDVPAAVVDAVEKAMQKQADDRFPTVNAFIETLTGRPLVQRSSMISLSPDRPRPTTTGKLAGQAAFANTVDSGSVAKSAVQISPHAATVASQDGHQPSPIAPAERPRPRALMLGLALACAVAIAAVIYLVVRNGDTPANTPVAVVEPDAVTVQQTTDAAEVIAVVDDAAISIDAAAVPDAAVVVKPDARTRVTRPVAIDRTQGDPLAWEWIDKAEAAFRAGNFDLAKLHCNSVIDNSQTASALQRSIALLMRGTIHCKAQSIGLAQGDFRAISIASYRTTLIARCKAAGQSLD